MKGVLWQQEHGSKRGLIGIMKEDYPDSCHPPKFLACLDHPRVATFLYFAEAMWRDGVTYQLFSDDSMGTFMEPRNDTLKGAIATGHLTSAMKQFGMTVRGLKYVDFANRAIYKMDRFDLYYSRRALQIPTSLTWIDLFHQAILIFYPLPANIWLVFGALTLVAGFVSQFSSTTKDQRHQQDFSPSNNSFRTRTTAGLQIPERRISRLSKSLRSRVNLPDNTLTFPYTNVWLSLLTMITAAFLMKVYRGNRASSILFAMQLQPPFTTVPELSALLSSRTYTLIVPEKWMIDYLYRRFRNPNVTGSELISTALRRNPIRYVGRHNAPSIKHLCRLVAAHPGLILVGLHQRVEPVCDMSCLWTAPKISESFLTDRTFSTMAFPKHYPHLTLASMYIEALLPNIAKFQRKQKDYRRGCQNESRSDSRLEEFHASASKGILYHAGIVVIHLLGLILAAAVFCSEVLTERFLQRKSVIFELVMRPSASRIQTIEGRPIVGSADFLF